MRRWMVMVVAIGALAVVLLGWRSFKRMMDRKQCGLDGGQWSTATQRCEARP